MAMPTIRVALRWRDGRITETNVNPDDVLNIERSGVDGVMREFAATDTQDDEGREIYAEVVRPDEK
jgi:hypothetical protein